LTNGRYCAIILPEGKETKQHNKQLKGENNMKRAKYNEVPKDIRRNYKEEAVEVLKMFGMCAVTVAAFVALFILCA
jgi:hypothetical protein